jgi:uncharacterized membrane protein
MHEPTRDAAGFRLRGLQTTRIETFTDAAFAFALTLLVVSLDPPATFTELTWALRDVPAFLLSAGMLMMFWWAHHEWSRRYGLDDGPTLVLSCLLVFTVLIYVYPLRFMFGLMASWIGMLTGAPLGGTVGVEEAGDVNRIFAIYGVGFTAMSAALVLLNVHAWRMREVLQLDALERHETRSTIGAWLILASAGLLSLLVAILAPPSFAGLPGWVYALLTFAMPLYGRWMKRRRAAVVGAAAAPTAA